MVLELESVDAPRVNGKGDSVHIRRVEADTIYGASEVPGVWSLQGTYHVPMCFE